MVRIIGICAFGSALAALSANVASAENVKVNTTVPTVKVPTVSSPKLYESLHNGTHFKNVTIEIRRGARTGEVTQKGREGTLSEFQNGAVVYDKKPPTSSPGIKGLDGIVGESKDDTKGKY